MRDEAVVLAVVNTGTRHHAEIVYPAERNDQLQAVHHDINQDERVRNMPVTGDEGTLRSRCTPVELAVAVGADYTRIQSRLTFTADGAAAAPTPGIADAVGVVNADRGALPVIHVVGKVLHRPSNDFVPDFPKIFRGFSGSVPAVLPLLRALLRRLRRLRLLHERDEQQGQQHATDKATGVACVGDI